MSQTYTFTKELRQSAIISVLHFDHQHSILFECVVITYNVGVVQHCKYTCLQNKNPRCHATLHRMFMFAFVLRCLLR